MTLLLAWFMVYHWDMHWGWYIGAAAIYFAEDANNKHNLNTLLGEIRDAQAANELSMNGLNERLSAIEDRINPL